MKEMESQAKLSLKLQAYQYLKTKILNCEYRPNEFLNEQKLCAEMGNISRTPMRDALGRLEQEGLITILPKKGLMVSGITEEDVHSMFEMRLLVEPYALRTYGSEIPQEELAAFTELMHNPDRIDDFCKADDDFHELLMSTLPNKYLRSAYDRITGLNTRFRIMTGKVSMINQEKTCEEHLQILDAALSADWDGDVYKRQVYHRSNPRHEVAEYADWKSTRHIGIGRNKPNRWEHSVLPCLLYTSSVQSMKYSKRSVKAGSSGLRFASGLISTTTP